MWYIRGVLFFNIFVIEAKVVAVAASPALRMLAMTASAVFTAFAVSRLVPGAAMMNQMSLALAE